MGKQNQSRLHATGEKHIKFPGQLFHFAFVCLGMGTASHAQTLPRKHVSTEADLPRFSYPVNADLQRLLDSPAAEFNNFSLRVQPA